MWSDSIYRYLVPVGMLLLSGCSGDGGTGPLSIKWDRDSCERCRMVLSDRYHAAQIRYFPPDKQRSVVARFDDIGCAVLWLADKPWQQDPRTRIWVTDHATGVWIDATRATYVRGHHTPMDYGLGAQEETTPGGLNFTQAQKYIRLVDQRHQAHTTHLLERLKEQQQRREVDNGQDANRGVKQP
ncbi:MAG: nitrous oxide reductase accessory protein NosL [Candidatus Thiodiazotropha sp.]